MIDAKYLPDGRHFVCCEACLRTGKKRENCYCPCHDVQCPLCGKPQSWHVAGILCQPKLEETKPTWPKLEGEKT